MDPCQLLAPAMRLLPLARLVTGSASQVTPAPKHGTRFVRMGFPLGETMGERFQKLPSCHGNPPAGPCFGSDFPRCFRGVASGCTQSGMASASKAMPANRSDAGRSSLAASNGLGKGASEIVLVSQELLPALHVVLLLSERE